MRMLKMYGLIQKSDLSAYDWWRMMNRWLSTFMEAWRKCAFVQTINIINTQREHIKNNKTVYDPSDKPGECIEIEL